MLRALPLWPTALVLLGGTAYAAPLVEPHLGGVVFVGPTSSHPSSVYWNPAALAQDDFRGSRLFFSGSLRHDRTSIERDAIDPATGAPGGSRAFDPVTLESVSPGGMFAIVSDLGTDRYRFGLSLYTPVTESFPDGGDELGYHTRGGYIRAEYATGSLAVRATGNLLFGVGFSFVFSQTDLSWDRDRGLEDCPTPPCSVEDPAHAERIRIDTDNVDLHPEVLYDWKFWRWPETIRKVDTGAVSLAFNAGVMARIPRIPELWFALSWISFPTFGGGTVILDGGRSEVIGLEDDGRTGYRLLGDARSGMRLPQIVHFGVRYDLTEDTRLLFGFRWYDLSRHGNLDVRISGPSPASKDVPEVIPRWRGLKDVFSVDGGVEHYFHDRFRAAVQLRLESSGVPARSLAPHQVDAPKAELGFGGEFVIAPNWKATLGYSLALLLPQDTGVSAFDPTQATACRESGFDLDVCEAAREGRAVPSAAGHYSRLTQELTFGFELRFK